MRVRKHGMLIEGVFNVILDFKTKNKSGDCSNNYFKISQLFQLPYLKSVCVFIVSHSVVSDSLLPPWSVAHQAPLILEFFRQKNQSGLPLPPPGDLLNCDKPLQKQRLMRFFFIPSELFTQVFFHLNKGQTQNFVLRIHLPLFSDLFCILGGSPL